MILEFDNKAHATEWLAGLLEKIEPEMAPVQQTYHAMVLLDNKRLGETLTYDAPNDKWAWYELCKHMAEKYGCIYFESVYWKDHEPRLM